MIIHDTVGVPQREAIAELEVRIDELKANENHQKAGLIEANIADLFKFDGIVTKGSASGIEFSLDGRWSFADAYINDRWSRDEKEFDVRYTLGSLSGYSSNEEKTAENLAKAQVYGALPQIILQFEGILDEYARIDAEYTKERYALYQEKRQLQDELNALLSIAAKKNEDEILEILAEGIDMKPFIAEGHNSKQFYTGYGDNTEYFQFMKLEKVAIKSITVTDTRVWSDGSIHTTEPRRFKKEDLFDDLYKLLKPAE